MTEYQKWCAENPIRAEIEQLENLGSIDGELSPSDQARLDKLYAAQERNAGCKPPLRIAAASNPAANPPD